MFNSIITSFKLLPSICEKNNNNKKRGVSKQLHCTACLDAAASALALAGCYCVTLDSSRSTAGEALLYCSDISRTEVAGGALTAGVYTQDQNRNWQPSPFASSPRLGKEKPPKCFRQNFKRNCWDSFLCMQDTKQSLWRAEGKERLKIFPGKTLQRESQGTERSPCSHPPSPGCPTASQLPHFWQGTTAARTGT